MSFKKTNDAKLPDESFLKNLLKSTVERTSPIVFKRVTLIKDKLNNDVYRVQSGRARNSVQGAVKLTGFNLNISIFSILSYIYILEYGYKGRQQINKHNRNISQAFGRKIKPVLVEISAHERNVDRKGRPFFYNSIDGLEEEVKSSIDSIFDELR